MFAKGIREEDVPRYRIRDKSAKGKIGQDRPRQDKPLSDSIRTSEEGYLLFWGFRGVVTPGVFEEC